MPTLRRDDGIQFVIQSYRELLTGKGTGALKRKIRSLAIKHGEFVRLFKQDAGKFDAVFSREAGYLLGETVWHHFGKPMNMIFCEALPEKQQALLVVIRSGSVYLDTKTSYANLLDEFASLALSNEKYVIYVYGDVPLSDQKTNDNFAFDHAQVESFTHLVEPIFHKLVADPALQLQPLELALTSSYLNKPLTKPIIIGIALLFAIIVWAHFSSAPIQTSGPTKLIPLVDPYGSFNEALTTPSPDDLLTELNTITTLMYTLPGWQITDLTYKDNMFTVSLQRTGGQAIELQSWINLHRVNGQITNTGVILKFNVKSPNRSIPRLIYNSTQLLPLVIDQLSSVITRESITTGSTSQTGATKYTAATINFTDFSPTILDLVGKILGKFPIQVVSITIKMQNNLLSGNIQLNVWGN